MAPLIKLVAMFSMCLLVAAQGTQFITGECSSDADCASGCCGLANGKCAARLVAEEGAGCGFNGGAAFQSPAPAAPAPTLAPALGTQFITGECTADADCASGCCGLANGKCAARLVAEEGAGCGFGGNGNGNGNGNVQNNVPAVTPVAQGTQFITGLCTSDADCAAGCCGFNTGKCAGPVIAQERDGGCGFGDDQPNDIAAQQFRSGQAAGRRGLAAWVHAMA
ncbi:hypothetical protein P154DRAFT_580251 [Amniculicola lignicola CBS 123094]|uniref:Biotrophy-associated secreted protein 2 n=1 Tax=Amniculicola lignicola CBS 123094 TaxID=1392246 RepID=A0A6A5W5A0_9PLEO|nr:hypothetical protein P154DRAFT_580251 [Amniculicola lignicola CBS 123094]